MSISQKKIALIFPHHLFKTNPFDKEIDTYFLFEEDLFFNQYHFHKQKIAFHRATLKSYEAYLSSHGKTIHYIEAQSKQSNIEHLILHLANNNVSEVHHYELTDNWLNKNLLKGVSKTNIKTVRYASQLFINNKEDLQKFFRLDKKNFHQTTFYKQERKKLNLLLDKDGKPEGGKWTYDSENRKKYPKSKTPPPDQFPNNSQIWAEAIEYTNRHFNKNPGELQQAPLYPINFEQSEKWFSHFLDQKFYAFGDYEDAIVQDESILHHSLLSPLLNCGLLLPENIVREAVSFAKENDIPLNSLEGFVRQIIGWREFIRGIYELKGVDMRTKNFWGFKRKIPASFYNGTTGITPLDDSIKKALESGYCHHIERLMVIGNFMLLCEFDPDEVYKWFMELFIDAYDWVMVPNVYGMSQFSDGGFFATKPYISSSNYILKMSNYKTGDWQEIWDGLFWRFMHKQRSFFESNPRLAMLVKNLDRMSAEKLENHLSIAQDFISGLDSSDSSSST